MFRARERRCLPPHGISLLPDPDICDPHSSANRPYGFGKPPRIPMTNLLKPSAPPSPAALGNCIAPVLASAVERVHRQHQGL